MEQDYSSIREHLITYNPSADQTEFVKAEGVRYYDKNGQAYINLSDIACVLGYGHPKFTQTLAQLVQTKMIGHPGVFSQEKEKLVSRFMHATHGDFDKILFTSSGGEVVDWCIKAARKYTGRDGVVCFRHALR